LGQFLLVPVLLYETQSTGIKLPSVYLGWINCFSVALLMGELVLMFLARCASCIRHFGKSSWLRVGLIFLIILGLGGENIRLLSTDAFPIPASQPEWVWPYVIFLLLLFVEESLGRWLFYAELDQRTL
jgi:hypothetical protein